MCLIRVPVVVAHADYSVYCVPVRVSYTICTYVQYDVTYWYHGRDGYFGRDGLIMVMFIFSML